MKYGFFMLCTSLLLASCNSVDLSAVTALSGAAQKAQPTYDAITQDYQASCIRTQQWYMLITAESNQSYPREKASASVPALQKQVLTQTASATAKLGQVTKLLGASIPSGTAACNTPTIQAAIARWNGWNHLLIAYYAALGNIAAKPSSNSDYGITSAATSMQQDKLIANTPKQAATVADVSSAAITAIDAYLDAKRRNAIADFAKADSPGSAFVKKITAALAGAGQDYIDDELAPERIAVDQFYSFNLYLVPGGTEVLTSLHTYTKEWSDDDGAVQSNVVAAQSYIKSLKSLESSYDAIAKAISDNDISSARGLVALYVTDFNTNLKTINQALTKGSTSK